VAEVDEEDGVTVPLFVPVAFSEEEALHLLGAARTIIHSGVAFGEGRAKEMAPLAQAMVRLAEATDKARERKRQDAA
jgi:hypothetical protein